MGGLAGYSSAQYLWKSVCRRALGISGIRGRSLTVQPPVRIVRPGLGMVGEIVRREGAGLQRVQLHRPHVALEIHHLSISGRPAIKS
jgi:hypothetical protein